MLPLNMLPLDTIGIVIGISILVPSLITILFIKIRRFEEFGMVIGVFLLVLSLVTYFYIIPNEVVQDAILPEEYIWEDEGDVYYWEKNSVVSTEEHVFRLPYRIERLMSKRQPIEKKFKGKEVIYVSHYEEDEKKAIIHEALYDDKGEVLTVINGREKVSEWYGVDTRLSSLEYFNVDAGRMGIPSNHNGMNSIRVGWVESNGEKEGRENIVVIRDMKKIRTGFIEGIEFYVWESNIYNRQITWHGEPYICDETLRLTVEPRTGYVIHVYRHLVLSAHLSQFIEIYHPDITRFRYLNRFLNSYDPIGEAAELIYETTEDSQAKHIAEVKALDMQLIYLPIAACVPMFVIGAGFLWRYGGRSYYWKRYKDFER
ncbi:MAG: hypothetical protein JSW60_01995 [Thermoplasmatales archaeon]|nr:MAG: hypothetical protein JSW60_01995 [Thermoplasmatales archaeon]